jgi:hypothetical protein
MAPSARHDTFGDGRTETFRYPKRFKVMTLVSAIVFTAMTVLLIGWADLNGIRHLEIFGLILFMLGMYIWWCVVMYRRQADSPRADRRRPPARAQEYGKGRTRLADTQAVDIETVRGTVRLSGFRDGSLELYRALDDWLRSGRGPADNRHRRPDTAADRHGGPDAAPGPPTLGARRRSRRARRFR